MSIGSGVASPIGRPNCKLQVRHCKVYGSWHFREVCWFDLAAAVDGQAAIQT